MLSWLAGAYGLQLVARGTGGLVRHRRFSRQEPRMVHEVRSGLVLVRGRVVAEGADRVEASLSWTPCVLAQSRIADLEGTIVARMSCAPFAIFDSTGRARVLPEHGRVEL